MRPNILVQKAMEDASGWNLAQVMNQSVSSSVSNPQPSWCPPITGEFKCNIGFAWFKRNCLSGVAWVVRDS